MIIPGDDDDMDIEYSDEEYVKKKKRKPRKRISAKCTLDQTGRIENNKQEEGIIESKNLNSASRKLAGRIVTDQLKKFGNKINDDIKSKSIIKFGLDDLEIELHALRIDDIFEFNSSGLSYYINKKHLRKLIDIHSW